MQQKYYWIIGIVITLAVIGIILVYFLSLKNIRKPEPQTALSPYIVLEGTIVSLSLDKSENYYEGSEIVNVPSDSAVVRIDRIVETGGSYNFNWASLGIEEGKEASLNFKYTVRPTKIITVVGETAQSGDTAGDTVSHTIVPTKITFEDGYFVFRINGNLEKETILPGLQEGSKFKTILWETSEVKVEEYEIIP